MCGISGYIGKSKNKKITYELATRLFDYLELRGTDAAGIWGTDNKDKIIYHKEPGRSSDFIKSDIWKDVKKMNPNLLLMHARATSPGVGHARHNINNHPFVSSDHRIGMIHNGRVSEAEFLKNKYKTRSDTDSEVLLRMYEHGMENENEVNIDVEPDVAMRLKGLRDIWSLIHEGAMAVAFGEYINKDTRHLYLFRNQHRPLWIADVRDTLGQIFFFSSPEIWYQAIASSDELQNACESMNSLIEIQVGQIWFFKVDKENPSIGYDENSYCKFDIEINDSGTDWTPGNICEIKDPVMELSIVSQLDGYDQIICPNKLTNYSYKKNKTNVQELDYHNDHFYENDWTYKGNEHEALIFDIENFLCDLGVQLDNSFVKGSIHSMEYEVILESLNHIKNELKNTINS